MRSLFESLLRLTTWDMKAQGVPKLLEYWNPNTIAFQCRGNPGQKTLHEVCNCSRLSQLHAMGFHSCPNI